MFDVCRVIERSRGKLVRCSCGFRKEMQQMLDVPSEYGCATVDGASPLKVLSNVPSSLESSKSLMDRSNS